MTRPEPTVDQKLDELAARIDRIAADVRKTRNAVGTPKDNDMRDFLLMSAVFFTAFTVVIIGRRLNEVYPVAS